MVAALLLRQRGCTRCLSATGSGRGPARRDAPFCWRPCPRTARAHAGLAARAAHGQSGQSVDVYWLSLCKVGMEAAKLVGERHLGVEDWENARAARDEGTRLQRLVSSAMRRRVLARYSGGGSGKTLVFGREEGGKPFLVDGAGDIHFNVTHTPTLVGVCVGIGGPVGIDSENGRRELRGSVGKIAKRWFSAQELAALEACEDEAAARRRFYRLWTLKEAFLKATGMGISSSVSLRGCAFDFADGGVGPGREPSTDIRFEILGGGSDGLRGEDWGFATIEPVRGDFLSVCWKRGDREGVTVRTHRCDIDEDTGDFLFS